MHSFDLQLKCQNSEWCAQMLPRKKLHGKLIWFWKLCWSHSSAKMDLYLIILCQLVWQSMANITAHFCSIRWGWLFTVNNLNCLSIVSFCSRSVQHLIAIVLCKVGCNVGARRCWHILPSLQISPHVITACWHMWKNNFWINNLSQKTISTLLARPFYIIWAMTSTELQLMVYYEDGKSVCSAGDYIEWRTYV